MIHKHRATCACILLVCIFFGTSCVNNPDPADPVFQANQGGRLVLTGSRAAEAGDAQAQFELALTYATGRGPERNLILAYKWATVAAVLGHDLAKELREKLRKQMTPAEVAMGEQMASEFRAQLK